MTVSATTPAAPSPAAIVEPLPAGRPLVWWARALDAVSGIALLLLISIVVFGGFRLRYGDLRITAQEVWRPLAALVLAAGVRHWLVPHPSWPARLWAGLIAAWAAPVTRAVLPALIASRLMVLAVGYLGVALIGYPDKLDPPNRVSSYEWVNLPVRWDAGWYLGIALNGYNYDPNARPTTQQNVAFFPAYPMAMRTVTAWLGGRLVRPDDRMSGNRIEWQYALHRRALAAGLIVSIGAFGWGLVYLYRLVRALGGDETAAASAVILTCAWPCALFYSAVYSEGLFFLGVVGAWYHLRQREWAAAFAWGLVTGLSRPNGFLVSVPLALLAVADWRAIWRGDPGGAPNGAARRRGVGRAWRRRPHLQRLPRPHQRASAGLDGGAPGMGPGRHRRRRPVHRARRRHREPGLLRLYDRPADRAGERDVGDRLARAGGADHAAVRPRLWRLRAADDRAAALPWRLPVARTPHLDAVSRCSSTWAGSSAALRSPSR